MAKMKDEAALRAARKNRLASVSGKTELPGSSSLSTEKPVEKTPEKSEVVTAATKTEPQVITASVADVASVQPTDEINLVPFGENTPNAKWVVFANAVPVFEIRLEDQDEEVRTKYAGMFSTPDYALGIKAGCKKHPLSTVMNDVKGRAYQATVSGTKAYKEIEASVKSAMEVEYAKKKATIIDDHINMVGLVDKALNKGYLSNNPLKAAMFNQLSQRGISSEESLKIIEAAFAEGYLPHQTAVYAQAAKWSSYTPESIADLAQQITNMDYRAPTVSSGESTGTKTAGTIPVPSEKKNVPFVPRSTITASTDEADEHAKMRGRLFGNK